MIGSWIPTRLSEVVRQVKRSESVDSAKQYRLVGVRLDGGGPFIRETKLGSESSASSLLQIKKGDFIFSRLFAWRGAFGVVPPDLDSCYVSNEFPTFEVDDRRVDAEFLRLWFRLPATIRSVEEKCSGSTPLTRNRFKEQFFLAMEVPLPPLDEQRRIVARIEELAAKIEEARGIRQSADTEIEMAISRALEEFRSHLLSSDHMRRRLGEITTVTSGGTPSRSNPSYWGGTIPWIKTGELTDGDLSDAEEHITVDGLQSSSARLFPPDTVLIALYGQGQTRGRTARLTVEAATNQACCAILPTPDILEARYTQYWLRSLYRTMRVQARDGAQPNWNGKMIKGIEIVLPPLGEQRSIVSRLDLLYCRVEEVKRVQAATAAELDAMIPSILDAAFTGQL